MSNKAGTPLRVLIVEDSEDDAKLLVRELRRGGYDPTFERVDTPCALRAAVACQEWDIVLADYGMPHFSGTAVLSLVRERRLDLPFIFLSGVWTCHSSSSQERSRKTGPWKR